MLFEPRTPTAPGPGPADRTAPADPPVLPVPGVTDPAGGLAPRDPAVPSALRLQVTAGEPGTTELAALTLVLYAFTQARPESPAATRSVAEWWRRRPGEYRTAGSWRDTE
ncbi:acyl-CoA carboxylase epsilon subunit [Streptomyces sp. NPDC015220]|uniref:acyl-CoA carboxylase epsilon subunit n=1 Tax=Streptomyces sp. NPDC015220 TaxID=3364947 RepID=UPI0036FC5F1B